jgi:predicted transcriptional regulator
MRVRDMMRTDFIWFHGTDSLEHVLKVLAENSISSAPVYDEEGYVGVISSHELAAYFSKKDFASLWKKNRPSPIEKMRKSVALDFTNRKSIVLRAEDTLEKSLVRLSQMPACVPVIDKGKIVGLVRGSDIIRFLLTELAKDSHAKAIDESESMDKDVVGTAIDLLLLMVNRERAVKLSKAAKELGIPAKSLEKLADTLQKHHLIKVEYNFFSGPTLRMIEHDKK